MVDEKPDNHEWVVRITYDTGTNKHIFCSNEREADHIKHEIKSALLNHVPYIEPDYNSILSLSGFRSLDIIHKDPVMSDVKWLG